MEMPEPLHQWDVDYDRAREIQEELRDRIELQPLEKNLELVAGADMSLSKEHETFFAGVVVMRYPDMKIVEKQTVHRKADFPYIPGLLTFREGPAVLGALEQLAVDPDLIVFDGQGMAHPRRMGLATHMGIWLDMPTVGCAKSRLIGEHEEPGAERGSWTRLMDEGERIGTVLRTQTDVKPLFVSPGNLCSHEDARRIVLECATRYKMPEPTRQAHLEVGRAKRRFLDEVDGGR